jgi:predicted site-specific integrase-resolvase
MVHNSQSSRADDKLLLNVKETAHLLGDVSHKSVYRWIDRGLLEVCEHSRHKLIKRASIDKFVEIRTE